MHKQRLLEALRAIRDEGPNPNYGVCNEVFTRLDFFDMVDTTLTMQKLHNLFRAFLNWTTPEVRYPVGGPVEYGEEQNAGTLWKNPRRHELLHFCINRLDQELNVG